MERVIGPIPVRREPRHHALTKVQWPDFGPAY
jgi:hypothetical protein